MDRSERHVRRFVFGRLLPIRGVEHKWERRFGWHWIVEKEQLVFCKGLQWVGVEWLHGKPWDTSAPPPP